MSVKKRHLVGAAAAAVKLEPLRLLKKKKRPLFLKSLSGPTERRDLWLFQKQHQDDWLLSNPKPSSAAMSPQAMRFTNTQRARDEAQAFYTSTPEYAVTIPWTLTRLRAEEEQLRCGQLPKPSPVGRISPSGRPYSRFGKGQNKLTSANFSREREVKS